MKRELITYGVVALLGSGAIGTILWQQREIGAERERRKGAEHAADSLGKIANTEHTRIVRDTFRIFRSIRSTDTVLTTIIDTAVVHRVDTVKVPVQVLVQVRDTLRECQLGLGRCLQGWEKERVAHEATRKLVKVVEDKPGSWFGRWGMRVLEDGAAFTAGRASCGVF